MVPRSEGRSRGWAPGSQQILWKFELKKDQEGGDELSSEAVRMVLGFA